VAPFPGQLRVHREAIRGEGTREQAPPCLLTGRGPRLLCDSP